MGYFRVWHNSALTTAHTHAQVCRAGFETCLQRAPPKDAPESSDETSRSCQTDKRQKHTEGAENAASRVCREGESTGPEFEMINVGQLKP